MEKPQEARLIKFSGKEPDEKDRLNLLLELDVFCRKNRFRFISGKGFFRDMEYDNIQFGKQYIKNPDEKLCYLDYDVRGFLDILGKFCRENEFSIIDGIGFLYDVRIEINAGHISIEEYYKEKDLMEEYDRGNMRFDVLKLYGKRVPEMEIRFNVKYKDKWYRGGEVYQNKEVEANLIKFIDDIFIFKTPPVSLGDGIQEIELVVTPKDINCFPKINALKLLDRAMELEFYGFVSEPVPTPEAKPLTSGPVNL